MRVFSQGQLAQVCARALVAVFVWSALCSGIVTVPASAQVTTRSVTNQSVAVVPFEYAGAYHPDAFGEEAAAAVAVDLEQRLTLDVLPAGEVALEMKNLGLKPPLDTSSLVRLASNLEVNMLVWGRVSQARVVADNGERRGVVTLAVRLFDRTAQADMNGALVTSYSPPKAEASDDELIGLALKQAVFDAVTEMKTRPAVTAVVIWAKGDQVFTNTGTRGGINVGTRLVAVRDGERIAVVQITEASATGADGRVVSGSTLRTGDHLMAIYDLPGTEDKPTVKQSIKRKASGLEKPAIMVGAIALLAGFAGSGRAVEEGNKVIPGFTASGLANGSSLPDVMTFPLDGPANLLTWTKYSNTQSKRVIAYLIFRGEMLIDVIPLGSSGGGNYLIDQFWPFPGSIGTSWMEVILTIDPTTGSVSLESNTDSWLPEINENGEPNPTYESWHDGLFIGVSNDGTTFDIGWIFNPVIPNVREFYRVRPVIVVMSGLDQNNNPVWRISEDTEISTSSNPTTGVAPPLADQAFPPPGGTTETFSFYQPVGADEMILQVQRDQGDGSPVDFAPGPKVLTRVITGLNPAIPDPWTTGVFTRRSIDVNLSDLQALQGTSTVYWWRVGARNRNDQTAPRPFPLSLNNDYGWIWDSPLNHVDLADSVSSRAVRAHEREQMRSMLLERRHSRVRPANRPMGVPERR